MRLLAASAALGALLASTPTLAGDDAPTLELEVGKQKTLGPGAAPICDDPAIAWISAGGQAVLHADKVGTTTCSYMVGGGGRRVYRIVVVPPKPAGEGKGDGKGGAKGGDKKPGA
jgi:hypothetical protein